jgi:hypothetical protein
VTAGRTHVDDTVDVAALRAVVTDTAIELDDTDVGESARRGTRGVLEFFARIDRDREFETTVLPLGDGVTVSTRLRPYVRDVRVPPKPPRRLSAPQAHEGGAKRGCQYFASAPTSA